MERSSSEQRTLRKTKRTFDLAIISLFAVGLGAAFPSPTSAQTDRATLTGRVVDLGSNTVVAGANVVLIDTDRRTTTDDSGSFEFSDLIPGTYLVEVTQLGYERHTDQIELESGETLEVRFSIGIDAIPLKPITVVARSRSNEDAAHVVGRRFDGMSRPEIEAVLGRVFSMADLIREARTPGVSVIDMTTWVCAEHGRVTRRRRDAQGTGTCRPMAVYIDGVRQTSPGEALKDVVPETVERFEILSPMQGAVLYGQNAESGVIVIETQRGGRRLGAPSIVYSHDQPKWIFSLGAVGMLPSYAHNGPVILSFPGGSTSSLYQERSTWRGGVRASASVRLFGYHRLRVTGYGVTGSSTGRYTSIRPGRGPTVQTRGHRTSGFDFTYMPRLRASETYDLRVEFGPTLSFQRLRLSEGHNDEWADPVGGTSPTIEWQDRKWTSLGATVGIELNRIVSRNWSWFAGARLRALYYGDTQQWEFQNIEDIVQQTGNVVFITYHHPLALHPALSVGLTWRPSNPTLP